jgi:glucose-6-phosphate isomerase
MQIDPGPLHAAIEMCEPDIEFVPRIWERDHTVWQDDPEEVADRLGWLDCPTTFRERIDEFTALAKSVRDDGLTEVLLIGMGGSSLYPEVLAEVFGPLRDGLPLRVLDTTHPDAVARVREELDLASTLVVVSSKSGTTIETRSHFDRLWADLVDAVGEDAAGAHVVAITDPGSELVTLGQERNFRAVVENPADIGGRFSALSAFGLVPAALLGVDLDRHLAGAAEQAAAARAEDLIKNHAAHLGIVLGAAAQSGRYQLTLLLPDALAPLGAWIEQLVAESTGKQGTGLLPILDEPVLAGDRYGRQRLVVAMGDHPDLQDVVDAGVPVVRLPAVHATRLGAEVFRWEFATAMAGAVLGINPFDQPDVQAAKTAASRVLREGEAPLPTSRLDELLSDLPVGEHLAILAFVDPEGDAAQRLTAALPALRDRVAGPVTLGIGPRYLHSTGQFHKGGPDLGAYAIVLDEPAAQVDIPGQDYDFGTLLRAQAAGDAEALEEAGRRVAVVDITELTSS